MLKSWVNKIMVTIAIAISAVFFYTDGYKLNNLHGDAFGYYLYLPSTFIYHNTVKFWEMPHDMLPETDRVWENINGILREGTKTAEGTPVNQYTYGVAFLESPFFFAAHAYEKMNGLKANGFSDAYQIAIKIAGLFYLLAGLVLVYKILRRYYSSTIATATTLVIFLGSNLFYFGLYHAGMSHVPLFFLFSLLIYLTIKVHEKPTMAMFLLTGFVAGLITVTRPTDIICLLIPLLYQVYNRETFHKKLTFLWQHRWKIIAMAFVFMIPAIPQMMYWHAVSGKFIYYSYGHQEFYWKHPRLIDGLIGTHNGWLTYSPAMVFAVLGYFIFRKNKEWQFVLWTLVPLFCYIIYSWYCYNYINGLGSRPMIHMYALLALPMAAFFEYISKRNVVAKSLSLLVVLFFISVNISYSILQRRGKLHSEESTYSFNLGMLYRTNLRYKDLVTKDIGEFQPDDKDVTWMRRLGFEGFEDTVAGHNYPDVSGRSKYVYRFSEEEYFDKEITIKYHTGMFGDAKWFRCSADFLCPEFAGYYKHLFMLRVIRDNESIVWAPCKVENKIGVNAPGFNFDELTIHHQLENTWSNVSFYVKIPGGLKDGDKVVLGMWNIGKRPLYMDNMTLDLYK